MSDVPTSPTAQRLLELGITLNPEMPYDLDSMFPKTEGWGAKGEIKRKHKLIQGVEGLLARTLKPGEQVLYLAHGVQNKFIEQYFLGIWAHLINQTVFVLTNLRLIMLHTNTKGRPQHMYWMIYYNQIKKFKTRWTGEVALDLVDGTKLRFTGFRGIDKKQMPAVFEKVMADYAELGFNPESTQSRENLCGNCVNPVPKNQYACPQCGQQHWAPSEVALRSLVFPSWGDFVMGHTMLAVVELLGYAITWMILLGAIVSSLDDAQAIGVVVVLLVVLAFEHGFDAAVTYSVAKKGLVPKGKPKAVGSGEVAQ